MDQGHQEDNREETPRDTGEESDETSEKRKHFDALAEYEAQCGLSAFA